MFVLRLLGANDLRDASGAAVDGLLAQPSRFALLAYLGVRGGELVRRDELLALFWPELDEQRARNALSQALHVVRRTVGAAAIISRGMDVGIDATLIRCDAAELARLALDGQDEEAVALYGGDLLPAFNLSGVPEFERWVDGERLRLRAIAGRSAWRACDAAAARGDLGSAVRFARRAVDIEQDERALRRLMTVLDSAGDRAAALRAYHELSRHFSTDLGVELSPETIALAERLSERDARTPLVVPRERAGEPFVHASTPATPVVAVGTPPRSRRRSIRVMWAVIAIIAVSGIGWAVAHARALPAHGDTVRIAVMPFSVFASPDLAYLSGGMMDVLSLDLDGVGPVRTIDPHAVVSLMAHADTTDRIAMGVAAAKQLAADRFVLGTVVVTGARTRVSASLYDAAGKLMTTGDADVANASEVVTATDRIARELLAHELPTPAEGLSRLAALTSSSTSALRHYLEGERFYRDGHFDKAAEAFGAAVHDDSLFALGDYRLAASLDWGIHRWEGKSQYEYLDRAIRHMSRLSLRDQHLIQALHEFWVGTPERAAELYGGVVAEQPDNVEAWEGLAEATFHRLIFAGTPISNSRTPFERVLGLDPQNVNALVHLTRLAALRGDVIATDTLARSALTFAPTHDAAFELRLQSVLSRANADERKRIFDSLRIATAADDQRWDPTWLAGWRVATFREDPEAGVAIGLALADAQRPAGTRLLGELLAGEMYAGMGRWDDMSKHLENAAKLDARYTAEVRANITFLGPFTVTPARLAATRRTVDTRIKLESPSPVLQTSQLPPAFVQGLQALSQGDTLALHAAERTLDAAKGDPGDAALFRLFANMLRAKALQQAGAFKEALALLEARWLTVVESSGPQYARASERMLRADLLHALGREREAITWYRSIPEDLGMGIVFAAPAHLGAAHAFEALGDKVSAAREYGRVAAIWNKADGELAAVAADARRKAQMADR
ncbi:MAG: Transcriptional activator protein [Gemmatimonadetes bacterium]|nr:Transcriptional activator protein [Gemmatimonadota bacterium]